MKNNKKYLIVGIIILLVVLQARFDLFSVYFLGQQADISCTDSGSDIVPCYLLGEGYTLNFAEEDTNFKIRDTVFYDRTLTERPVFAVNFFGIYCSGDMSANTCRGEVLNLEEVNLGSSNFVVYGDCDLDLKTCYIEDPFPLSTNVILEIESLFIDFSKQIDVYRLQNNQCNLISIIESERTSNDYDTLSECEENIIGEITCEEFCQNLTSEPCEGTGSWAWSGTYSDCSCEYSCEEENQTIIYIYKNYTIVETKIVYVYQDCNDIGCPSGFECQESGVCTKEIIKEFDWEKFWEDYKLWIILGGILFLLLLIPRRK